MQFDAAKLKKLEKLKTQPVRLLHSKITRKFSPTTVRTEVLAGVTVALALIPESLAFAAIAGVSPMVALYTSFSMAVVIAFTGGRIAMISAATGSMALLMVNLVQQHGVEYLFAATILTGILQLLIGIGRLDRFFSFIPPAVIAGFVNALGILIFVAQLQQLPGESWPAYGMVAATLVIVYLFPRLTKAIPAPLVAIVAMTAVAMAAKLEMRRVGDIGEITRNLPTLHLPQVSFSVETLAIILPYAVTLAIVGLLESLLTAALIDEMTDSPSSKNREVRGQGVANIVTGFLGGMAGCGMVGQSIINVRSGARRRLSTCVAGVFLLFSIYILRDVVQQIPMAALVGVMIMVAFETFDWQSLKELRKAPLNEALIMPITVAVTIWTHNLAYGVLVGVALSVLMFGWRAAKVSLMASIDREGTKVYHVAGQLFFGSAAQLSASFDYQSDPDMIAIDFSHAHVWDYAAAQATAKVMEKYQRLNKRVTLIGLDSQSYGLMTAAGIPMSLLNLKQGTGRRMKEA
ncbi:MAG: SulP family inorganic anion transporter [Leptolyngbya sp. IPPAS B-1204]|nr:MAG: SulP family inorganic anion transporter [Leptolyngbya sp. IPPAS B-1204]